MEEIKNSGIADGKRKVVVFSQWIGMLKLVSDILKTNGYKCCYYDGSLPREARKRVIYQFSEDPDVDVLVISLKAGGVGLNLTAASVVILLDPWWNPGVEQQAIDRVHRLGQTKEVIVKKYIVQNTVETMILKLQERKAKLARNVLLSESSNKLQAGISMEDLIEIFEK
jgi:DNA repair protein RAD5